MIFFLKNEFHVFQANLFVISRLNDARYVGRLMKPGNRLASLSKEKFVSDSAIRSQMGACYTKLYAVIHAVAPLVGN